MLHLKTKHNLNNERKTLRYLFQLSKTKVNQYFRSFSLNTTKLRSISIVFCVFFHTTPQQLPQRSLESPRGIQGSFFLFRRFPHTIFFFLWKDDIRTHGIPFFGGYITWSEDSSGNKEENQSGRNGVIWKGV